MDAVGNVLAERRQDRFPWGSAALLALALHAGIAMAFLVSAMARPIRAARPRAVAVRLLPAGALRVAERSRARAEEPASSPKPKIEKPPEEEPAPSKKAVLLPAKEAPKKATPPPVSRPGRPTPAVSLPSAGSEPDAHAGAAAGAGGAAGIGGFRLDQADFHYPVYIERMAAIISLNWFRPAMSVVTNPVVHFRIQRDGTVVDAEIVVSSGLPYVDRAALRAVISSSPLPPLPAEYPRSPIGVQVTFE